MKKRKWKKTFTVMILFVFRNSKKKLRSCVIALEVSVVISMLSLTLDYMEKKSRCTIAQVHGVPSIDGSVFNIVGAA